MKRFGLTLLAAIFTSSAALSSAWAGVDYIKYHEEFQARKAEPAQERQKGQRFEHKSKYFRDEGQKQGTEVPTSEEPKTGQKHERPDWAK